MPHIADFDDIQFRQAGSQIQEYHVSPKLSSERCEDVAKMPPPAGGEDEVFGLHVDVERLGLLAEGRQEEMLYHLPARRNAQRLGSQVVRGELDGLEPVGGWISVDSGEGSGTQFTVTIPCERRKDAERDDQ